MWCECDLLCSAAVPVSMIETMFVLCLLFDLPCLGRWFDVSRLPLFPCRYFQNKMRLGENATIRHRGHEYGANHRSHFQLVGDTPDDPFETTTSTQFVEPVKAAHRKSLKSVVRDMKACSVHSDCLSACMINSHETEV